MFAFYNDSGPDQKGSGVPWVVCLTKNADKLLHLKFQLQLSSFFPPPLLMGKVESMHINVSPDLVIYFGMWLADTGLAIGGMKSVFLYDYFGICVGSYSLIEFN